MKREIPGFVRELPITILTLLILASVFSPLYLRYFKKKAEELKTTKAQEMELMDEMIEDAPESLNEPESAGDSDDFSDH